MKAFLKTLQLLGVTILGSVGFLLIFSTMAKLSNGVPRIDDVIAFLLIPPAFALEIWIYKLFFKRWRTVFLNYVISHFAGFFSVVVTVCAFGMGLSRDVSVVMGAGAWFASGYFGQYHILYVERLEAKIQKLDGQIAEFEEKRIALTRQMTTLQGKVENQKRWTDQQKKRSP